MADVQDTLEERGKKYGSFSATAEAAQAIKSSIMHQLMVTREDPMDWGTLDPDMRESLELIATKIGRITTGDPWYADSWHDIAGYAQLVADRLQKDGF